MPTSREKVYYLAPSKIQGTGTFAGKKLSKNQTIGLGIGKYFGLVPYVTKDLGAWLNHSYQPNCHLRNRKGLYYIVASRPIPTHDELTLDYRNTPWYIAGPESHYK